MSKLPFLIDMGLYPPLQPEDTSREEALRASPAYRDFYVYHSVAAWARYEGVELAKDVPASENEYNQWKATCKQMDEELSIAIMEWREAVAERDLIIAKAKVVVDERRAAMKKLQLRRKPEPPKRK